MKNLNLYRIWEILNKLSNKQDELAEESIYVLLMGVMSNYCTPSFEGFLNYYSFRIDGDDIIVFNNDAVGWESFNNDDFSYIPTELLEMLEEDLDKWIDEEVDKQLYLEKLNKSAEKDRIKEEIKRLEKQLEL